MKKKQKLSKRDCKQLKEGITILILFAFVLVGCKSYDTGYSLPVIYDKQAKKGEIDGADIHSLDVRVTKLKPTGNYIVLYSIIGQITPDYWHTHHMLKKIRLIEENCDYQTAGYNKRIILTPVQCPFGGKAGANPLPFRIENRYVIKNDAKNPLKKVLFVSGDKEFLLELP